MDVGTREETSLVDIALDPNMYYRTMSTVRTLYKAAELGFEHVELSPNADFHFWHHRPAADDAFVAELNKAQKETGVKVRTLNPVFNWSSPDEEERRAQVSNWRRLLELAEDETVPPGVPMSIELGWPSATGCAAAIAFVEHNGWAAWWTAGLGAAITWLRHGLAGAETGTRP